MYDVGNLVGLELKIEVNGLFTWHHYTPDAASWQMAFFMDVLGMAGNCAL